MKKTMALVLGACLAVAGVTVALRAQEKAPESYEKLMRGVGHNVGEVGAGMKANDASKVASSAAELHTLFGEVGKFWAERKAEDAVAAAQAGEKAAGELEAAAKANNTEGMEAARKSMMGTCATCHTAHREKMPDGKWGIK